MTAASRADVLAGLVGAAVRPGLVGNGEGRADPFAASARLLQWLREMDSARLVVVLDDLADPRDLTARGRWARVGGRWSRPGFVMRCSVKRADVFCSWRPLSQAPGVSG